MRLVIDMDMGGAAFEGSPAGELLDVITRMWADVARTVEFKRPDSGKLRDSNGNTCGTWRVEEDE